MHSPTNFPVSMRDRLRLCKAVKRGVTPYSQKALQCLCNGVSPWIDKIVESSFEDGTEAKDEATQECWLAFLECVANCSPHTSRLHLPGRVIWAVEGQKNTAAHRVISTPVQARNSEPVSEETRKFWDVQIHRFSIKAKCSAIVDENSLPRHVENGELAGILSDAIDSLKTIDYRRGCIVELYHLCGMTYQEIALKYGVTGERIRQIELVGMKKLRFVLEAKGYTAESFGFPPEPKQAPDCECHAPDGECQMFVAVSFLACLMSLVFDCVFRPLNDIAAEINKTQTLVGLSKSEESATPEAANAA